MKSSLYIGKVFHARHQPFGHKFTYRVFSLFVDLDTLDTLGQDLAFFSFNRWNILSLHNKDHGPRDGSSLRTWIESAGQQKGIDLSDCKIFLLCFPRLWGYVFNPISIYFCYAPDGALKVVLYQVKNTFGQQHCYLHAIEKNEGMIQHENEKIFHVSPFIEMDCTYKFRLQSPDDTLNFAIHQFRPDGKILTATWDGIRKPLTNKSILKTVLTHPLMTVKVIAGIHWEALRLWMKGAKYIPKPPLPEKDIS